MDGMTGAVAGALKDTVGAQLISKTLEKLNGGMGLPGKVVNQDYQFQKDVLQAAGIGTRLDAVI